MFVLSLGRKACDELKTIKSEFVGALESINFTLAEQSGGHAGGEVGLKEKPHRSLSNSISPFPTPHLLFLNMSGTFAPLWLQEAQGKFP